MLAKINQKFPNYIITSSGDVYNKKGRKLNPYEHNNYLGIYLYSGGARHFKLLHRLIAETFIPNPYNLPEINHKDENTVNNRIENLEWCDRKYNANYGTLKKRQKERMLKNNPFRGKKHSLEAKIKMRNAKLGKPSKRKRSVQVDGINYESVTEALKLLNISTRKLYKILEGNYVRKV